MKRWKAQGQHINQLPTTSELQIGQNTGLVYNVQQQEEDSCCRYYHDTDFHCPPTTVDSDTESNDTLSDSGSQYDPNNETGSSDSEEAEDAFVPDSDNSEEISSTYPA